MVKETASVLLLLGWLTGCGVCENEVSQIVESPSGKTTAFVFNRRCGATVGANTQLSIVRSDSLPNDGGNVLILDDAIPLAISWSSDVSLQVAGPLDRVVKKEESVEGVRITYLD